MKKSSIPITQHITLFLEYIEIEKGLSQNTVKSYANFLKQFSNFLTTNKLSNCKPHQLTADHIWKYRIYLSRHIDPKKRSQIKKSTQGYYLIALRALLDYFSDKDIESLPSEKVKLPKQNKDDKKIKFLSIEQIEKLLLAPNTNAQSGLRDRAILETLFSTGLRVA